jgi:N-methylhydantoinase B
MSTDPVTTEILRSAFNAAAQDMNATLIRSAYTPTIYEMKDCSVALLDAEHRILGQSSGLPLFLGNLEVVTRHTEQRFGRDVWRPGDIWLLNDSYIAGAHLPDVTIYGPVFGDQQLIGFAVCRAHLRDIGAMHTGLMSNATEIYQEGIRLGATKIIDAGEPREDILDILTRNSRFPVHVRGDVFAMIACVREGQKRLDALLQRHGAATLTAARDEIFRQSERAEREFVAAIPDGRYQAEGFIDNDGILDRPRRVSVQVDVSGEEVVIDLTESDDLARGPVNCGRAQAESAARVAFKILVDPAGATSGGSFRTLTVKIREGSMFDAVAPHPTSYYFTPLGLLIDLVIKAVAPVLPERAAAACYGDSMVISLGSRDAGDGKPFGYTQPTVGGWGAWPGSDGQDALINNVNGSLKDLNIEVIESKFPIRVERYQIRVDSGGAGQWRGGNGVERRYVFDADEGFVHLWFDRSHTPAWGIDGGEAAQPPEVVINEGRPDERRQLKGTNIPLRRGDTITTRTGGGGGCGDPADRDRAAIARDIAEGYLTAQHAEHCYRARTIK